MLKVNANSKGLREQEQVFDQKHRGNTVTATPIISLDLDPLPCNMLRTNDLIYNINKGSKVALRIADMTISESFEGLLRSTPREVIGQSDYLSGFPEGPLTLKESHNKRDNLYVTEHCIYGDCDGIALLGRGPAGKKGVGAMSILLDKDTSNLQLSFDAYGASEAEVMFFARNGEKIGTLLVDIQNQNDYSFDSQQNDIAGFSISPIGSQLKWHKYKLVGLCHDRGYWE